jgi:2-polyprenyl-3-methyl-5-hydroxy-6-metoxy-1,4-benzoquinol methylase
MALSLTDQRYWDSVWSFTDEHLREAPLVVDGLHQRRLMQLFRRHLRSGARFLEVGAGGSAWPAHVAATLGAEAWGIDFSRGGLAIAAACASRDGVPARLVEGDFFDRQRIPGGAFHVVYSGGFVEHFPEPRPLMQRLAELLAPDGVVVTTVPNLDGINGFLQRLCDRECYRRHVVFTPASLDAAHALGGLVAVEAAQFVGVIDLGSVNFSRLAARLPSTALKLVWAALSRSRRAGEALAQRLGKAHGGRALAPAIIGVYARG